MLTNDYFTDGPKMQREFLTRRLERSYEYLSHNWKIYHSTVVITNMITNVRLQRKHVIRALSTDGGQDQPLSEPFALPARPWTDIIRTAS